MGGRLAIAIALTFPLQLTPRLGFALAGAFSFQEHQTDRIEAP